MADGLNCHPSHSFNVKQHAASDRFTILAKKLKVKLSKEEKESSEGETELSENENLLEELIALSDAPFLECYSRLSSAVSTQVSLRSFHYGSYFVFFISLFSL